MSALDRPTTRRRLLLSAGAAAAGAAVARVPVAMAAPSLAGLERDLKGPLVVPGDAAFAAAARVWNPYAQVRPKAVAFCASPGDVAKVMRFARDRGWALSARSGRHSFEGYSNCPGIVADVSRMATVRHDAARGTVRVGAGARTLDVYRGVVLAQDAAVPLGTCPTVGIAGLTLGGGISRMVRRVGMTSDSLVGATVVLPSGRTVRCDASHERDLFWALRGGGGGNFGIVTELVLRTSPAPPVSRVALTFDWAKAAEVTDVWQRTLPQAPDRLAEARLRALKIGTALSLTVSGQYHGPDAEARELFTPLLALGPKSSSVRTVSFAEATRPDGCTATGASVSCGAVERRPNDQRSDFVSEPLPASAIAALVSAVERWPGGPGAYEGGVQIEAFGAPSAVNRVAPSATAFVHRDALFHIAYLNFWGTGSSRAVADANVAWVDDFQAAMRPAVSGFAYQNYIDRRLASRPEAYYGANLARLRRVRQATDPKRLLRFAQGI